jgi:peroxiredoxin
MKKFLLSACASLALCSAVQLQAAEATAAPAPTASVAATASLFMYPQFMAGDFFARNWMKTVPHKITLSETPPPGITKEPKYKGTPLYGTVQFGDDPAAPKTILVMDDAANRVYIDENQNGDLTDDAPQGWQTVTKDPKDPTKVSYEGVFTFPGNWKTGPGKYGIKTYRPKGSMVSWFQTVGAPTGVITLDGKPYVAFLYDGDGKGVFNTLYSKDAKTFGTEIFIDTDGDGTWRPAGHNEDTAIGKPFQVADKWYLFNTTADGHTLTATPTDAPPESKEPKIVMKQAGDIAPNFTMQMPDGKLVQLSDFKGKTVVIDFWATWCGPCQRALPEVQKLWSSVSNQSDKVAFIGLCVSDEKPAFTKWIQDKGPSFTFNIGYDPAGNTSPLKGQCHQWGISGIPSMFVIDPSGKIVQSLEGFSEENEAALAATLNKMGIKTQG